MNETLAQYANLAVYSAMAVLTLAMIGYAAYLAWLVPARADAKDVARSTNADRELVAVGGPGAAADQAGHADATAEPAAVAAEVPDAAGASGGETRRARKAAGMAHALAFLGTALLLAGAVLRGASVSRWPLGNMYEFAIMGSLFTMVVFLAWSTRRDLRWLGVFVVTPVLLTLGLGTTVWYTEAAQLMPSLRSYWLVIHVTVATISVALFAVGFALTGLYLARSRFDGTPHGRFFDRLPAARALERMSYGIHVVAFPLWTFTVIAGAIWARQAWGSYWNWDPKEVWTFVIWVVYAAYLHARATAGWKRQAAAWIAIAGFACIIMNYAIVNMYFVGQHSYSGL
jgi:cytochrome c-type biogenesis protein CcsB